MRRIFYYANLLTLCLILSVTSLRAQTPHLTINPVPDTVCNGTTAMFVAFSPDTAVHYYWEVYSTIWDSVHDGSLYSGATTDTLRFTATTAMNGYYYRVAAYNGAGISALSPYVTLTVQSPVNAGTISGAASVCTGATTTLTASGSLGGMWMSSNTALSTVSSSGAVTGVGAGTDTIAYTVSNHCNSSTAIYPMVVNLTLTAAPITGPAAVCLGSNITLSNTNTGGTWTMSNAHATISTTGVVTSVSNGPDTATYSATTTCGVLVSTKVISVDTNVTTLSISGASLVCTGFSTSLTGSVPGGTWTSSNTSINTVNSAGSVTGVGAGTDTIGYMFTNACGSDTAWHPMVVNASTTAAPITGASAVCVAASTTLANANAGGTWSVSNTNATISTVGVVTGVSAGLDTVIYTLTTSCGAVVSTTVMSVQTLLSGGSISGAAAVCRGFTTLLTSSVGGGIWMTSDSAVSTITSGGLVSGVAVGADTILYIHTNSCGTDTTHYAMTVDSAYGSGAPITGPATVCVGSIINQMNIHTGGAWSVTNGHATISTTGVVSGVSAGLDTVIYIYTNTCGSVTSVRSISIDTPLSAGTLTGGGTICAGSWVALTTTGTGGIFLSGDGDVATVDGSGYVTGRTQGTAVISYMRSNVCGVFVATDTVHVQRTASVITGHDSVGISMTTPLMDSVAGGMWTSSDTTIARVNSATGVVTGVSTGTVHITYTATNVCGVSWSAKLMHVGNAPSAGAIYGSDSVCAGSSITLADTLVAGGTWSISNANASISISGVVTGIIGGTWDTVMYTYSNAFGSTTVSKVIYINRPPVITVSGPATYSLGNSYNVYATPTGGTWMSTRPSAVRFISDSTFVILHDTTTYLIYTVSNTCGTSHDTFTVTLGGGGSGVANVSGTTAQLMVFPNPNAGSFALNLGTATEETAHIVISNMIGETVKELTITTNKVVELTLDQPTGVYMINATTDHGKYSTKVTVTK